MCQQVLVPGRLETCSDVDLVRTRITAVVGLAALIAVPAGLRAQVREAGSVSGVVVDAVLNGDSVMIEAWRQRLLDRP